MASSPERLEAVSRGFERHGFVLLAAEAAGLNRDGGRREVAGSSELRPLLVDGSR